MSNITATTSENSKLLVEKVIVAPTETLFDSQHSNVGVSAVCILTNIVRDGPELRNRVIAEETTTPLLKLIQPNSSV